MRLSRITVQNLGCIKNETFDVYDFTTLIGPNNTGKSTVLRAIEILLNQEKPDLEEWNADQKGEPIVIKGIFTDVTETERDIPGIAGLVYEGQIQLRLTIAKGEKSPDLHYDAYVREEHIEGWSDSWRTLSEEIKQIAEDLRITSQTWRTQANKERIREGVRKKRPDLVEYGDPVWTDEGISIKEALLQGLPRAELVPAVKDAQDEQQLTQKRNIFREILEDKIYPAIEQTDEYTTIVSKAEDLSSKLKAEGDEGLEEVSVVSSTISAKAQSVLDLRVLFRLEPLDIRRVIGSSARIRLSDGTETPVHLQGHGAQRTLIYALIDYVASQRAQRGEWDRPIVLLFEEPELFIHPQLMRTLTASLRNVSKRERWQVVMSTHSPVLVDVSENPRALVILRRDDETREIIKTQLQEDPFVEAEGDIDERMMLRAAIDFHPTVCEVFFARNAILVEGDSEVALFRHSRKVLNMMKCEDVCPEHTTVVSCAGKWTILPIARLLQAFQIPFKIIHDLDRKGLSDEQLKRKPAIHPFKANARLRELAGAHKVFVIQDTLEDILFADDETKISKDKPYNAWRRLQEIIEQNKLDDFPVLKDMFRFAYGIGKPDSN